MQSYPWPGNVRELENEVQRLVIQVEDGAVHPAAAPEPSASGSRIRVCVDRVKSEEGARSRG